MTLRSNLFIVSPLCFLTQMKFRNPFTVMLGLAGALMSDSTRAVSEAKADMLNLHYQEEPYTDYGRTRRRYNKSSTLNQRQIRKNRRRAQAAGCKLAHA